MAFVINDRVQETTTTTGTGTVDLNGALTGFESFISAIGNGNTTYYAIASEGSTQFEVGIGTVTSGSPNTLSRDTVISSSNSDALVNFSAGTKTVFCTLPASKAVVKNDSGTILLTGNLDTTGFSVVGSGSINVTGPIISRVTAITDAASITINADTTDIATQANTQAVGTLTINAPTGTPVNGQKILLRLRSTNVQTFSFNAAFTGSDDLSLPTTSSGASKYDYMGFAYNSTATKWQLVGKVFGF
jgi:hypothetical protein